MIDNNTSKKVLYLRWRPQAFTEVIGQEHVTTTLKNAVMNKNWSHAYLFSGPRGVGKTSSARILAKALNCQNSVKGEPCEKCSICKSVTTGNMIDLIEIDAASHRKIEDIRDLKDSAQYLPNSGKYKVYIIDEAHGLTKFAAEALLKLLEEPPPQVIIILATTEIQSLPPTIVSRCQRFDFRRIGDNDLTKHLTKICETEKISATKQSLELITKVSTGSLRDAENILEQISVQFNSILTEENVSSSLGLIDETISLNIASSLLSKDTSSIFKNTHSLIDLGIDPLEIQKQILSSLRELALIKIGETNIINQSENIIKKSAEISAKFSLKNIVEITNEFSKQEVISGEHPPISLEMALISVMIKQENSVNQKPNVAPTTKTISKPIPEKKSFENKDNSKKEPEIQKKTSENTLVKQKTEKILTTDERWLTVCEKLKRSIGKKYNLGSLLRTAQNPSPENSILTLKFKSKTLTENMTEEIKDQKVKNLIESTVSDVYNETITIKIISNNSSDNNGSDTKIEDSPIVRMAITMGGKVINKKDNE